MINFEAQAKKIKEMREKKKAKEKQKEYLIARKEGESDKDYKKRRNQNYYKLHKSVMDGQAKIYQKKNPKLFVYSSLKYKLKMKSIISEVDFSDIKDLHTLQDKKCFYCQRKININKKRGFHVDHMTPISKGGQHVLENIVIACPDCNMKKGNLDLKDFIILTRMRLIW